MDWSYDGPTGPANWKTIYANAAGSQQSPINIPVSKLKVINYYKIPKIHIRYEKDMTLLSNSGYFWHLHGSNIRSYIYGGPLQYEYELHHIHAHWREPDVLGSEHGINGQFFPSEFHLVHWNKKIYGTFSEATNHLDGLCVFGVMAKLGRAHPEVQKVVDEIPNISHYQSETEIEDFDATKLLPNTRSYWSYLGSLTTPPCSECVRWIIFDEPIEISKEQLASFRTIHFHTKNASKNLAFSDEVMKNARPTFSLGYRDVIRVGTIGTT